MNLTAPHQEIEVSDKTPIQQFCTEIQVLTKDRYKQALLHCGFSPAAASASVAAITLLQNTTTTTTLGFPNSAAATLALTQAMGSISISDLDSDSKAISLPCHQIYRNWHLEDLQRREKQLPSTTNQEHPTTFLLSYPSEKYNIIRDQDLSPIVNSHFNLLGVFFCATAAPTTGTTGVGIKTGTEVGVGVGVGDGFSHKGKTPITTKPVPTSPYGKARFQVPFEDLERNLFPRFQLFFADFYRVKEDWYVQLVVVPSWNGKLESQCREQGLIALDVEANPFFFRRHTTTTTTTVVVGEDDECRSDRDIHQHSTGVRREMASSPYQHPSTSRRHSTTLTNQESNYEYRVCSTPKVWTELFIGCDVIPTSEIGETVESLLHANVRKTANTLSILQERQQLATILEGVATDLSQMAGQLHDDTAMDVDEAEGEEAQQELKEAKGEMRTLLEITYRLSRDRTRLGVLQAFRSKVPLSTIEE
ncbi:hypothetical protein BGZ95_008853 [Linnemannia exigua]|uniref:Phytanoyl-CoA hydroxylase-interacting protein-like C-terminal domain-containing protein n=1 Tax=Linnemannia exigua TaxID=604196 RepID=A0AAD4H725_9FUNG|nr:hypothetical protein BGZ95_008853 [Linnemannia exigua]